MIFNHSQSCVSWILYTNQHNTIGYSIPHPSSESIVCHIRCFIISMACIVHGYHMCVNCLSGASSSSHLWFYGDNIALLIDHHYIDYYYIDAFRITQLGCSYFASPDYMLDQS